MPDAKKLNQQKRSETEPAGEEDYNPVNMAGKKTEISDEPSQEKTPGKDEYNPVNMAGKKADTRQDDGKQKNRK